MANTLGVSRVSVANALATLESEGLVIRGFPVIRISDARRLHDWVLSRTELQPVE